MPKFAVGEVVEFIGYRDGPPEGATRLVPNQLVAIEAIRPHAILCRSVGDGPVCHLRQFVVYPDELRRPLPPARQRSRIPPIPPRTNLEPGIEVVDVPEISSRLYKDLRDRAAYMHITGSHPSHLRRNSTRKLTAISEFRGGRGRSIKIAYVEALMLESHPMVVEANRRISEGWTIHRRGGPNARHPFSKVFLQKNGKIIVVNIDGSVKDL